VLGCERALNFDSTVKAAWLSLALSLIFIGCRSERGTEKATGTSGSSSAQNSRISSDVASGQPPTPGSPEATAAISGKQRPTPRLFP
jgi:hypothetical protein